MAKASNKHWKSLTLTPYMRVKIRGDRNFGISFGQIAAKYKIPSSTVSGIIYRATKQDNGKTLSRPGWPKVLTVNNEQNFLSILRCRPYYSYSSILAEVPTKLSLLALQWFLSWKWKFAWMAKKRPYLSTKNEKKRLKWAKKHKDKSKKFWSKIMWTDE